jgi:hypothetical protein
MLNVDVKLPKAGGSNSKIQVLNIHDSYPYI